MFVQDITLVVLSFPYIPFLFVFLFYRGVLVGSWVDKITISLPSTIIAIAVSIFNGCK